MKRCKNKSNLDIIRSYVNDERPFAQVSMTGVDELRKRKEGEEWTDTAGKNWKKVNGVKMAVGKAATVINEERCTICDADTRWGNKYDRQIWPKTRKCYDCFIEFETLLKGKGLYDTYERHRDLRNVNSYLVDLKSKLTETIEWCENTNNKDLKYFNDDGIEKGDINVETWKDNTDTISKIKEDASKDLTLVNDRLKDVFNELSELKVNLNSIEKCEDNLKIKYKDGRNTPPFTIELVNK